MRLLLDTHALVWWLTSPDRLSERAASVIGDPDNEVLVSAVSAYEIELKRPRDSLLSAVPELLTTAVTGQGFAWLQLTPVEAMAAARLPQHHRDPWDRIIVAQAMSHDAAIVTADRLMSAYGAPVVW